MSALMGICHKRAQPINGLGYLNLCYLLVLEKFHSNSYCLLPQISRFVAEGISHFVEDQRHCIHLQTYLCNKGLCFLWLSLEVNFQIYEGCIFCTLFVELSAFLIKLWKVYWLSSHKIILSLDRWWMFWIGKTCKLKKFSSIMLSEISQVVRDKYHMISPLTGT